MHNPNNPIAELARLREEQKIEEIVTLRKEHLHLKQENAALKAEVERLRTAAKALGDFVKLDVRWNHERDRLLEELDAELDMPK